MKMTPYVRKHSILAWTILIGGLTISHPLRSDSITAKDLSLMALGAAPIPSPKIPPPPKPVFNVQTYGAKGDGSSYDTEAIQKAIDACAGTGGSVYLSNGKFLSAALELKSNMTFYVAKDAVLLGGLEPEDYPEVIPYTTNESVGVIWNRRSLLYANQAHGLRLDGGGIIDGRGKQVKIDGTGGHMAANAGKRPSLLRIFQSNNVIVHNLTIQNPRMWTMVYERCQDLLIEHLQVSAPAYYENLDGMDICDCSRVIIRNCVIESEDDSICLKSHSLTGLKDILITNNIVTCHRANAIKIGTATLGPIEDIRIRNNTIRSALFGGLCIESVDGSIISNVVVRGLEIKQAGQPIFIRLAHRPDWRKATPNHRPGPGAISDLLIEDVRITSTHDQTKAGNSITGIRGARLRNITLRNIHIEMPGGLTGIPATPNVSDNNYPQSNIFGHAPAYGFYVRHADNVTLENISIGFLKKDARKWLGFEDASVETKNCIDRRLISQAANHPRNFVRPEPSEIVALWQGDAPGLVTNANPETYVNERYQNVSVPQLLVYLPPKEKANGTSLIICAGGAYSHLAMCIHVENVVRMLNDRGITVFGLKYRTRYGKNDVVADALADGKRAVRLVRSRAAEWNINPDRVGVQGYSAGANLCLNLISHFDKGDANSADPVERFSSRPDFCVLMAAWPNGKTIDNFPLGRNTPPTWLAIARDDTTAPIAFSQSIDDKLKGLGVARELFVVETGGHGAFHYDMAPGPGGQWPKPLFAWLDKVGIRTMPSKE